MATAKKPSLVGKTVKVNDDLLDIKGKPHPFAGMYVDLFSKTGKAYIANGPEDKTAVLHDGDFELVPERDMVEGEIIPTAGVQHLDIPLDQIQESPFNPRKSFSHDGLVELAETIQLVGVMQPILVRPMPAEGGCAPYFEIVFGHRRFRASKYAYSSPTATIPAMVRELTDAQSARLQAIENLQREDLDPIEEAQGYADLVKTPGLNALDIGAEIGKSRTYVYNQIKLLKLCEIGKRLVRCGVLKTELAIEVARLTTEDLQMEALKWITNHADISLEASEAWAGHPPEHFQLLSYRKGCDMIELRFKRHLSDAIFGRSIMFLVADRPDCNSCPERAGNIPDMNAKGERADICTNPGCFELKTQAHLAQVAKDTEVELGGTVISAVDAAARRLVNDYSDGIQYGVPFYAVDETHHSLDGKTPRAALGKRLKPADLVHIISPKSGAVLTAVSKDLLVKHKLIAAPMSEEEQQQANEERDAARQASARAQWIDERVRVNAFHLACELMRATPRKAEDLIAMLWRLWVAATYGHSDLVTFPEWLKGHNAELAALYEEDLYDDDDVERSGKAWKWLSSLGGAEQSRLCMELTLLAGVDPVDDGEPDVLLSVGKAYGVDHARLAAQAAQELDAEPAGS